MDVSSLNYSKSTSVSSANVQENVTQERPQQVSVTAAAAAQVASEGLAGGLQAALPNTQSISRSPEHLTAAARLSGLGRLSNTQTTSQTVAPTATQVASSVSRQPQLPQVPLPVSGSPKFSQAPDVFIEVPDDVSTSSTVSDLTNPRYSRSLIDEG